MSLQLTRLGLATVVFSGLVAGSARGEEVAPEFALSDLSGQPQSLRSHHGKIVVLNLWATWYGPCAEEIPMLVNAQKRYGDRGLVVVGVSLDEGSARAQVDKFAKKRKVYFPIWVGGTVGDLKRLGLGEALPATAFLDAGGRIVGRVLGTLRKRDLRHRVEWMLGETKGEPPAPLVNNLGGH